MVVDFTTLKSVAECSTKAAMTAVLHLQPTGERLPLEAGIAGHAALAHWLETGEVSEALDLFTAHYAPIWAKALAAGKVSARDEERLPPENLRAILRHWLRQWADGGFPYRLEAPGMTEIAVTRDLGDDVTYVALIDAVVRSKAGGRWFLDWKTTSSLGPWWEAQQEDSGQFTGQRWAAESIGEVEGVVVGGIAFSRRNSAATRCPKHGVPYKECAFAHLEAKIKTVATTQVEIDAYADTVARMVKKLRRIQRQVTSIEDVPGQPMEGRLNGSCKFCDYRDWCRLGRPVAARALKGFEERVWDPLAEAKARRVRSGKEGA